MNLNLQKILDQTFGIKSKTGIKKVDSKFAVKYTRVSGEKQMQNDSIETQNKVIDEFAEKCNYQIVEAFGDTHESAKTDERKEFLRMINFCKKSRGRISTILVYKMTRFSRTGGKAISIADELRNKYGIHIIAVTEPLDTSNPNGVLFQEMALLFAKWDNVQRQQVTTAGIKSKYNKGEWLSNPPQGYSIVRTDGVRKIVINETGKKIKKAWDWKLRGMKNEEIVVKLRSLGVKMYKQQIHKIFMNPFYCGLIAHGMLDGRVIEGKHERMISPEVFFEIHKIRESSTKFGIPHKREDDALPLKVFMSCSDCCQPLTGYVVKRKKLYYYKCRTNGCKNNKSAKEMHKLFIELLAKYAIKKDLMPVIAFEMEYAYNEWNSDSSEREKEFTKQLAEITSDIAILDKKHYLKEELSKEKYDKMIAELEELKTKTLKELEKCSHSISNLYEKLIEVMELCSKLTEIWENGGFAKKEGLQKLLFPSGLVYDKKTHSFRTPKINSVIAEIARLSGDSALMEKGLTALKSHKSLPAG